MRYLISAVLLLLGGCAQLPETASTVPATRMPDAAATIASLSAGIAGQEDESATDPWWRGFGQPGLDALIETALGEQPDLAVVQSRVDAAGRIERLSALQAGTQYATDASITRERLSDNGLFPTSFVGKMYTESTISQTISRDLDWWGRNRALLRAAHQDHQAARDELAAARLDLSAAVADAYFAWAGVATRLQLAREQANRRRQILELLERRHTLGLDGNQPALEARRALELDEDLVRQLEYLDQAWRYRLGALTGQDPDHAAGLATPTLDDRLPPLPGSLPLDWLARRPDIAALGRRIEAASERSNAARAEFYPNLDLRLMVGVESLDLDKLLRAGSIVGSLGPALHLPLFNTRTLQARLGLNEAEYAGAIAAYNSAILDAARQSADAYALVASLEQRSVLQRSALGKAEQLRTLAARRQALGLSTPLETLESEIALLAQRISDSETRASRLRARVTLFHAVGGNPRRKEIP